MSPNSSIARALAAFNGKDDPLKVENDRLTARVTELETAAQQQTELFTAAATANDSLTTENADLRSQLEAAQSARAGAESRATAAEGKATRAEADATARIETAEKSVGQRASTMAMDQLAAAGQPPEQLPKAEGTATAQQVPALRLTSAQKALAHWTTKP